MKRIYGLLVAVLISLFGLAFAASTQPEMPPSIKIEDTQMTIAETQPLKKIARTASTFYGYRATALKVDTNIAELLRLRVSQINHCSYCLNVHYQAARDLKIPQIKIDTLSAWWNTDLFTDAEKAALTYAEALTQLDQEAISQKFPEYHKTLNKYYTEQQIVEIAAIVINMNIWTRLKLVEGSQPGVN